MTGTGSPAARVLAGLDRTRPWQEDFYRHLHQHPELSHQEHDTAAQVADRLKGFGYQVHEGIGGTGVVGVLENGKGPTVLLRADMDALPVREETGLAYASTVTARDQDSAEVPVMHACGHDVHVTCLLGAAALLAGAPHDWQGRVVALFQPAEELGDGARTMLEDRLADVVGAVDVAFGQHVLPMPAGVVGTRPGSTLSAADSMRITVHGRGAHGSMPQASVDPVVLAAMIVIRLQTVVAREIAPTDPAVLTVGSIQAGTKSNVIDDHAVLQLNVRSYDEQTRGTILDAVERIVNAESQASASPREPQFELFDRFPPTQRSRHHHARPSGVRRLLRRPRPRPTAADRQRGLQRHPRGARRALHVLGHRWDRPGQLPSGGRSRTRLPGHPGQPLPRLRPRSPADPRHRHPGHGLGRPCLAGLTDPLHDLR